MFTLSMVAFAGNPGSVSVIVRNYNYETGIYTQLDTFNNVISGTDTVFDVIDGKYASAVWSGSYLHNLTFNNVDYTTTRYTPVAGSFNADDEYIDGSDDLIEYLNSLPEFIAYDGIYLSCESMFGSSWAGYFIMGDDDYMCSVTFDWIYEVDFEADGYGNFVYPPSGTSLMDPNATDTMDECVLSDGDIVRLTYGLVWIIFQ